MTESLTRRACALIFCLLFTAALQGCGSSNGGGVYTGTAVQPSSFGSLTFLLTAPQAQAAEVPTGVSDVRFELFAGPVSDQNLVDVRDLPFQTSTTLSQVPVRVTTVLITFITDVGIPVQTLRGQVAVPDGGDLIVDLRTFIEGVPVFESLTASPPVLSINEGASQPLTVVAHFDNGFRVDLSGPDKGVSYASSDPSVAVGPDGVVSGATPGQATVVASLTTNGATRNAEVPVTVNSTAAGTFEVNPTALTIAPGSTGPSLVAAFTPAGGGTSAVVTTSTNFQTDTPGVTVSTGGVVSVAYNLPLGTVANVTATYTSDGQVFTDLVPVTVALPVPQGLVIDPTAVTLPTGGMRYRPAVSEAATGDPVGPDLLTYSLASDGVVEVSVDGVLTSGGNPGATVLIVRSKADPNVRASMQILTVDATVQQVAIDALADTSLYVSQGVPLLATATLSNRDVMVQAQYSPDLDVVQGSEYATVLDTRLVALETTGDPPVAEQIAIGFSQGTSASMNLTVREVQLTSAVIKLGDLGPGDEGYGKMPGGEHFGTFSVVGTFEDGSSRPLQVDEEYTVASDNANVTVTRFPANFGLNAVIDQTLNTANATSTMSVEIRDDIDGDLEQSGADLQLQVSTVDPTAQAIRCGFAHYSDDHRVLQSQAVMVDNGDVTPVRTLDARADFVGLPNFRLSAAENAVTHAQAPKPPVDPSVHAVSRGRLTFRPGFEGWDTFGASMVYSAENGPTDVPFDAPFRADVRFDFVNVGTNSSGWNDLQSVVPDEITVLTDGQSGATPHLTEVGRRLSFQTAIDYGDGAGPVLRSLDYPVFETTFDAVRDVWATFDPATETSTFFFKRTSAQHPGDVVVQAFDSLLVALQSVGAGAATEQEVEVVRRL